MAKAAQTQNLTIKLAVRTIKKARVLAAQRSLSISGLVEQQIEALVGEDERYAEAKARALARLDKGFHMGGQITATRSELHER
jgi:hypothetical protein